MFSTLVFYVPCLVLYLNPEKIKCTISDVRDYEWIYIFWDSICTRNQAKICFRDEAFRSGVYVNHCKYWRRILAP